MLRFLFHASVIVFLTILTQLGGIAWALALATRRRLIVFVLAYSVLSVGAVHTAPLFGRVAVDCWSDGPLQMQSLFYCVLNRHYVKPELLVAITDAAAAVDHAHPGTVTLVLDGSFPFIDGFPMLPHLSHDDGEKVDLAFYYRDEDGYLPGITRSPIGFFAFEDGPTDCRPVWFTLRWDLPWLQPLWRDLALEPDRMRSLLRILAEDQRVGKLFIEPHLQQSLGVTHDKIRFQGCRAARHDDHIHLQF